MLASIYFFILIELVIVSYVDLLYRKIKNIWPVFNLAVFFIFTVLLSDVYHFEFKHFTYFLVFIIVGLFLFALKIMGAGDSKFLATLFLLIPTYIQDLFMLYLLYSTIIVGGMFLLHSMIKSRKSLLDAIKTLDVSLVKEIFGTKFTFAPVILGAWIWLGWDVLEKAGR